MLPRLRPRCYYDLVIEVAIVRPGPIQGNMVHPYLAARQDPSLAKYPNEAVKGVLERTLGVPLFQEQAMRLAVVAAGFSPGEADQLRRAMAAWRRPGLIDRYRLKLLEGMRVNGLTGEFAEQVFRQIRGFGEYGFPESHAASFALLVYASCYLKCHYPAAFCVSLLNSQPMGFYAPSQLVDDAQKHGVMVHPADVGHSDYDCTLIETETRDWPAIRLGLRMIRGLNEEVARRIVAVRRSGGRYRDLQDLTARAGLTRGPLTTLADADALRSIAADRRAAIWQTLATDDSPGRRPLFGDLDADTSIPEGLGSMSPVEEVHGDYAATGLSLKGHPIGFLRPSLAADGHVRASDLPKMADGRRVRVAGMVLMRQRPGTAKGITFVTLEDETGSMNLVIFNDTWRQNYRVGRSSNAWTVDGKLENRQGIIHVIVGTIADLSSRTGDLRAASRDFR